VPLVVVVTALSPSACAPPAAEPVELVVFAASSLADAFDEIGAAFSAEHPNVTVTYNFGSSSALATQLIEGGEADVFASANAAQMQVAADAGRIAGDPVMFVTNRLVLIVPADNPAGITGLADLAQPGVRLVLAVPGVPVRDYTDQMVAALSEDPSYGAAYSEAFYANLVSEEENVRLVASKVALGEADAAIVYASDVTPDLAPQVQAIDIPDAVNVVAQYPIAQVADSAHAEIARSFIDFVLGEQGQAILAEWGFGPAPEE
jgi:molybdate transport system substrate-binding protein